MPKTSLHGKSNSPLLQTGDCQNNMKNFLKLCFVVLYLAYTCIHIAHAKTLNCGWGAWDDESYNRTHGGIKPPEDACPPGPQTLKGSDVTAWVWTLAPTTQDATIGRRGANRVVKALGYSGVQGTFREPDINGILDNQGKQDFPAHKNKPTFYLGASQKAGTYGKIRGLAGGKSGQTQTEAGFQWTPEVTRQFPVPGWKVFHRVTISTSYSTQDGAIRGSWGLWKDSRTRWPKQQLGRVTLVYRVDDEGYVSFNAIGPNIPAFDPTWGGYPAKLGKYPTSMPTNKNGLLRVEVVEVRRSVGLTQVYASKELKQYGSSPYTTQAIMDGSVVTNLNFFNGKLTKNPVEFDEVWHSWTQVGSTEGLYPNNKQDGEWVIDFAKKGPTQPRSSQGNYNAGYSAENVEIHMGNPRKVKGK